MKHRTAKGKMIDMAALAKANDQARAVGNAGMNARGDAIDRSGNVIRTVQAKARAQHDTTSAPVTAKMSDTPNNKPTKRATTENVAPKVVSETKKTREDGTTYLEIEFEDGSIDVKEIDE
jgi:hypothetical protein